MMILIFIIFGFVMYFDGECVFMVYCIVCFGDEQFGKYNGLGGKVELGEDVVVGMKCELCEEVCIEVDVMRLCGIVFWFGFGRYGEDYFGFIFFVDLWYFIVDVIFDVNEEGLLIWECVDLFDELLMWEGDCYFLLLVFDFDVLQFYGCLFYYDG